MALIVVGGKDGFDVTHPEYKNCFGDFAVSRTEANGAERWVFAELPCCTMVTATRSGETRLRPTLKSCVPYRS
jgi:hypothetical protein